MHKATQTTAKVGIKSCRFTNLLSLVVGIAIKSKEASSHLSSL